MASAPPPPTAQPAQDAPQGQPQAQQPGQQQPGGPPPMQIRFQGPPGAPPPTPEQIQQMQQQIAAQAQKAGMSVPEFLQRMQQQQQAQQQAAMQQRAAQQQAAQQQPIQPGPPKPEALALANWLRSQDLKMRTSLLDEKRRDMFKVKRAIRALQSEAYTKAQKKNKLLPAVTDRVSAENAFKLLPMSLLALRVSKVDPGHGHEGHSHGPKKHVKGQWNVKIEQQQDCVDEHYYIWLYEGSQWKTKLYAVLALAVVFAIVLFPLWPFFMRQGVWYLSMGMLGLLGLFFAMAFFRLILFGVTVFAVPPGLWLYPNLFEDVGFFDSFKPIWAWQETAEDKQRQKAEKKAKKVKRQEKRAAKSNGQVPAASGPAQATATAQAAPAPGTSATEPVHISPAIAKEAASSGVQPSSEDQTVAQRRPNMQASVEEADDD